MTFGDFVWFIICA